MPSVSVFPGSPEPTHDISLSDGTYTYGFKFAGGPRVLQEVPLSPPASKFDIEQRNWIGGRGNLRLQADPTGFNDSSALWSTTEGKLVPAPQWGFFTRADADGELPGTAAEAAWWKLYGSDPTSKATRWLSRYFYAASSSVAADKAFLFVRRVGTPGTLTLEYCIDNSGVPGTVQKTVTKTVSDITDTTSQYVEFDWSGTTTRTAGTTYHLKVYGGSADDASNHWEVLVNTAGAASAYSVNGTGWPAAYVSLYYRVTGADTKRQWKWFTLDSALYAVSIDDNRGASTLLLNGTRGTAKSATSTTIVATIPNIGLNMFAGAVIRIFDGRGDGQFRTVVSNTATTGGDVTFTVSAWDVTPDTTSKFVVYGTNVYTAATLTGGSPAIGTVTNDPAIVNGICYFPRGQSSKIIAMRVSGASHDTRAETTLTSDILYTNVDPRNGVKLAGANASLAMIGLTQPVTWGTDLVTPATYSVGASDYRITGMINQAGTLNVFKEDGRYIFDGTRVTRKGANFKDVPYPQNGKAVGFDDKYMWWSWGASVIRSMADNDTDMLNWRQGYEGLPEGRRGEITSIVSAVGWVFFVVDGGTSNYSSILMWNGFGWHEIFRSWGVGVRIGNAAWQSNLGCRNRLWFDVNGELAYMEFPSLAANPLKDSSFNYYHEGVLVTSTIDLSDAQLYKIFKNLRVLQDNSTGSIEVDYQTDIGGAWTPLGTATGTVSELTLNKGETFQIRFRFRISALNAQAPSIMTGWLTEGRMAQQTKYQYIGTFVAGTDMETMTGEPDTSSDTVYAWLQTCAMKQTKLTMRSLNPSADNKIVTVTLPAKTVNYVVSDEREWGGMISFAMLEV